MQRLQVAERFADVRQTKQSEHNYDDGRWNRNQEGEPAGLFWSEQVEQTDNQDRHRGEFLGVRNTEILKCGQRADRRRYQIISDEKKCADDGNDFAAMPHAGINTSTVRTHAGDDSVVD